MLPVPVDAALHAVGLAAYWHTVALQPIPNALQSAVAAVEGVVVVVGAVVVGVVAGAVVGSGVAPPAPKVGRVRVDPLDGDPSIN